MFNNFISSQSDEEIADKGTQEKCVMFIISNNNVIQIVCVKVLLSTILLVYLLFVKATLPTIFNIREL